MFGNDRLAHLRRMFADQFEPDGSDFIYRRSQIAAPVRVTAAERDKFVAQFDRRLRQLFWGMVGGTTLVALAGVSIALAMSVELDRGWSYALGVLTPLVFLALWWPAWNAPARALRGRPTLGPAPSPHDARRAALRRISWGALAGVGALAILLIVRGLFEDGADWSWGWILGGGALLVLVVAQSIRKMRAGRTG